MRSSAQTCCHFGSNSIGSYRLLMATDGTGRAPALPGNRTRPPIDSPACGSRRRTVWWGPPSCSRRARRSRNRRTPRPLPHPARRPKGRARRPAATPTSAGAEAPGIETIDHFIFLVQENRSFDHYFGTYPGAKGIPRRARRLVRGLRARQVPGRQVRPAVRESQLRPERRPARARRLGARRERRQDGRVHPLAEAAQGVLLDRARSAVLRHLPRPAGPARRDEHARRDARSRTTGATPTDSRCRTACSRPWIHGPCPRTCSSCRGGPPTAPTPPTP